LEKSKLRSKEINDYMKKGGKTKNDCSEWLIERIVRLKTEGY
jgi:hypothetical protein